MAALLIEKAEAERRWTENVRAAEDARFDLERRLESTADALRAAEQRTTTLEIDLDRAKNKNLNKPKTETREGVDRDTTRISAATGTAGGDQIPDYDPVDNSNEATYDLIPKEGNAMSVGERLRLQNAEGAFREAAIEMETLRRDIERAQQAESVARATVAQEREEAEKKLVELREEIDKVEITSERLRVRAESRLEELGLALEQEEQESGVQVTKDWLVGMCFDRGGGGGWVGEACKTLQAVF